MDLAMDFLHSSDGYYNSKPQNVFLVKLTYKFYSNFKRRVV